MQYFRSPKVTAYALACGAQELAHNKGAEETWRVSLWREHGVYHVRGTRWDHNYVSGRPWETFHRLKDARRYMAKLCRDFFNND